MKNYKEFINDKFGQIRVVVIENHNWFIGEDVVRALGYDLSNHSYTKYVNRYVSDKGKFILNKETQAQTGTEFDYKILGQRGGILVNEGGVNQLSFKSPLPDAQEFEEWICYEVLPLLNSTGGYVLEGSEEEFISNYFPSFSEDVKLAMVQDLLKQNKEFKEKANWYDDFMNSTGTYTPTQMGKLFKIGSGKKMNEILHENKIAYKKGNNWLPYETTDKSWYKLIVGEKEGRNYSQLKYTAKGIVEISKLLNIELTEKMIKELV